MLEVKKKYFYKNGKRFFYLADTCWGAFTSIEMPDWKYYLETRKREGFNAIQINILRQYDSTKPLPGRDPFSIKYHDDGTYEYDYSTFNEKYFDNAEKMLKEMQQLDMIPVLVLLWGNFVPYTWMNDPNGFTAKMPKPQTIPLEQIKPYVTYVVKRFKKYNPIYFVTGDVGFDDNDKQKPEVEEKYYQEVVRTAKNIDPDGIYTFHINGESMALPNSLAKQAQFFSFQSGHGVTGEKAAIEIPTTKRAKGYSGPIVDAELCYEGLTQFGISNTHRFSAYDVRRTAWETVLSGADAGLGYGAFGIWPWNDNYRKEQKVQGFLKPYDWRECLQFRGAKDLGLLKKLILRYAPEGLESVKFNNNEVKVGMSKNYWLIYSPVANPIDLSELNIESNGCKIFDLQTLRSFESTIKEGIVAMEPVVEDELIVIKK